MLHWSLDLSIIIIYMHVHDRIDHINLSRKFIQEMLYLYIQQNLCDITTLYITTCMITIPPIE